MELTIRPLTPDLLNDFLNFFDGVAFSDHPEWSGCYCAFFHFSIDQEAEMAAYAKEDMRNMAAGLIRSGSLTGYLAYAGEQTVGWCNAGDKSVFKRLVSNPLLWNPEETARVKAVVCFTIAPGMRRRGISTALLDRVIQGAAEEGYDYVEAYPATGELDCFQHYHGHGEMYERAGFVLHAIPSKDMKGARILRRKLP